MQCGIWRGLRPCVLAIAVAAMSVSGSAGAVAVSGQGTWESTLLARDIAGNPLASLSDPNAMFYYDTALGLTWLRDWNYARTSGFDADGRMNWSSAVAWAGALTVGSFTGWRLPTVAPSDGAFDYVSSNNGSTDVGYAKTGIGWSTASELGHMYYVTLGNKGICTPNDASPGACILQSGYGLTNTAQFANMQSFVYWSGTENANPNVAWSFTSQDGRQGLTAKTSGLYAVAVRPGDVAPVPLPGALSIFAFGVSCLGLLARRRKRSGSE